MKRQGFLRATFLTLFLTGIVCWRMGWFASRAVGSPQTTEIATSDAQAPDPLTSRAAWRWRQGQPSHWRACMLQR
jgi:hypothetical protein